MVSIDGDIVGEKVEFVVLKGNNEEEEFPNEGDSVGVKPVGGKGALLGDIEKFPTVGATVGINVKV